MNRPQLEDDLTAGATPAGDAADAGGQPPRLTHAQIRTIYFGLMLSMFLSALNQTIIATALPSIGAAFHDVENLAWVMTAYLLTATIVSPLYGKLSDIYGRRTVMLSALAIFLVGSIWAATAPNMIMLIVGRALQGLGGGGLAPIVQSTVADVVSPRERGRYQAYLATSWMVAGFLGPVLGGFLAEYIHWSAIFWINVPVILLATGLSYHHLKRLPRHDRRHRLDLVGAALMMAAAVALLLALSWGGARYPWASAQIVGLVLASGLLLLLFGVRQTHTSEPFLPISILRNRVMRFAMLSNATAFAAHTGLSIFMPIFYQLVHQLSATEAGMALVPMVIITSPASIIAGRIMMHYDRYKWFATAGILLAIVSMGVLVIYPGLPFWGVIGIMSAFALGVGALFPTSTVSVQNAVEHFQVGTATGLVHFCRQLMAAFAIAIMGAIMLASIGMTVGRGQIMQSLTGGAAPVPAEVFRWVFATSEAFLLLSLVTWLMMKELPLGGPDPHGDVRQRKVGGPH